MNIRYEKGSVAISSLNPGQKFIHKDDTWIVVIKRGDLKGSDVQALNLTRMTGIVESFTPNTDIIPEWENDPVRFGDLYLGECFTIPILPRRTFMKVAGEDRTFAIYLDEGQMVTNISSDSIVHRTIPICTVNT